MILAYSDGLLTVIQNINYVKKWIKKSNKVNFP